jgi:hypothetical protein
MKTRSLPPPTPTPSLSPEAFRRALNQRVDRDEGLRCALVALNCYRHRHSEAGSKERGAGSRYARTVGTARAYVGYARKAGFRGSVNAILDELAAGGAR